jgi:hypothetical protein
MRDVPLGSDDFTRPVIVCQQWWHGQRVSDGLPPFLAMVPRTMKRRRKFRHEPDEMEFNTLAEAMDWLMTGTRNT